MVYFEPFAAYRPSPEVAARVPSPPYDVVSTEEARALASADECSFIRCIRPEVDHPAGTPYNSDKVYATGVKNLQRFIEQKWLVQDPVPGYYLYSQKMGDHEQHGIVGCVSVDDYENGRIKRHELTRPDKENDRTRLTDEQSANVGPVFLMYKAQEQIDAFVARMLEKEPVQSYTAPNGVVHSVRVLAGDEEIATLRSLFSSIDALYVADGHHRAASAANVCRMRVERANARGETVPESSRAFLSVVFPDKQVNILDYNRIVKQSGGMSADEILGKIGESFDIAQCSGAADARPSRKGEIAMRAGRSWYRLTLKRQESQNSSIADTLDTMVLSRVILAPVFGVEDIRTDPRVRFVGGSRGYAALEAGADKDGGVAFGLFPVTADDIMKISDANELMPPKTTWFEPKLCSGLVVRLF